MRFWIFPTLLIAWSCAFSGGLAAAEPFAARAVADRGTYLSEIVLLLKKPWPHNRTVTIVCHGHSVPAGYFKTPVVETFNAYPHLLHRSLKETFPCAVVNVIVTAIGGENSESGARRFVRDVLPLRADVVTIDYGLNDRAIGLERARKAWTAMIEQAKAAGARVILLTPTADRTANSEDPRDPLGRHAAQIRELAAEHRVGLVDSSALFQQQTRNGVALSDLMSTSNHPNRKGHELVAESLSLWFSER